MMSRIARKDGTVRVHVDLSEEQAGRLEQVYRISSGELRKSEIVEAALSDFFAANRTKEAIAARIRRRVSQEPTKVAEE